MGWLSRIIVWRYFWRMGMLLWLQLIMISCSHPPHSRTGFISPSSFTQNDVLGAWETRASVYPVHETLSLDRNNTFVHIFQEQTTAPVYTDHGTWFIEHRASGCIYLHLVGMRYFHNGREQGLNHNTDITGTLIRFEEPCEHQTFTMPDKVILTVGYLPNVPKQISLFFPRTTLDESYRSMEWQR